jgi:hypothetical protein
MLWTNEFKTQCLNIRLNTLPSADGCWEDFNDARKKYNSIKRLRYFNAADGLLNLGSIGQPPDPDNYPNTCSNQD